jgi:DNA polymerase bacteriophage-type
MRIHLDIESRSVIDLRKAGVYVYAESPTTDIWCLAYSVDNGPIQVCTPTDAPNVNLFTLAIEKGFTFHAWNANFERIMWREILTKRYGWPEPKLEQWRCTMAAALAMGFPASLERVAPAVGLDITKDAKGQGLMKRMMRPRSTHMASMTELGEYQTTESYVWWDEPEKIARLTEYCAQDVEVERQVHARLCPLTEEEQKLWFLDQTINDRGLYIDEQLCHAAKKIVETAQTRLNANMIVTTEGLVQTCSNIGQLSAFLAENGIEADSLRKDKVAALLLRRDIPDAVRDALELRQDAAKAAFRKLDSALAGRSVDGRAKGLFFFNGATTGRWAGRRVQPQNLQRPAAGVDVNQLIDDILTADFDLIEMLYDAPLAAIGNAIRGIVRAAPGNQLIAADFNSIEARVLAWLAGEQWKLQAFAEYDAGTGPDLYKVAYGRSFGIDPSSVRSDQRQIGKVQELALGYQGGVGAFGSMARLYGVDLGHIYNTLCRTESEPAQRAAEAYEKRGKGQGLGRGAWIVAEIVKQGWRKAHPNVVKFWADLEEAALQALNNPGEKVPCGKLCFLKSGSFMWLRLPSGRPLCYPYPRLSEKELPWLDRAGKPATKLTFTYKTEVNRQWVDSYAYGGLWAENVTQATARDLLAEAMKRLEHNGCAIVSHAHDEVVAETTTDAIVDVDRFCRTMSEQPAWATGLPITAAGWSGLRYRKA